MKNYRKKLLFTSTCGAFLSLFVFCAPVAGSETNGEAETADMAAMDTQNNEGKSDTQHEDILDRALSPLDRAVSDINRDLNKGDDSTVPESSD